MSQDVFKAPKAKRKHGPGHRRDSERWSPKKARRTKEDFFTFCNIVLEYTQYETIKQEDLRRCNNTSPLDSAGSTAESFTSESTSSSISEPEHEEKLLLESSSDFHDESSNGSSKCDTSVTTHIVSVDKVSSDTEEAPSFVKEAANSSNELLDSSNDEIESGDEDSWELVTCFCSKPFSGRPMIECSECLTWIHLSCAKIRKSNIPEDFVCQKCRESKFTTRKSTRIRSEKKMISA